MTRAEFLDHIEDNGLAGTVLVRLLSGEVGLCAHWTETEALIDVPSDRDGDPDMIRVPFARLTPLRRTAPMVRTPAMVRTLYEIVK